LEARRRNLVKEIEDELRPLVVRALVERGGGGTEEEQNAALWSLRWCKDRLASDLLMPDEDENENENEKEKATATVTRKKTHGRNSAKEEELAAEEVCDAVWSLSELGLQLTAAPAAPPSPSGEEGNKRPPPPPSPSSSFELRRCEATAILLRCTAHLIKHLRDDDEGHHRRYRHHPDDSRIAWEAAAIGILLASAFLLSLQATVALAGAPTPTMMRIPRHRPFRRRCSASDRRTCPPSPLCTDLSLGCTVETCRPPVPASEPSVPSTHDPNRFEGQHDDDEKKVEDCKGEGAGSNDDSASSRLPSPSPPRRRDTAALGRGAHPGGGPVSPVPRRLAVGGDGRPRE